MTSLVKTLVPSVFLHMSRTYRSECAVPKSRLHPEEAKSLCQIDVIVSASHGFVSQDIAAKEGGLTVQGVTSVWPEGLSSV